MFDNDFKVLRLYTGNQTGLGERSKLKKYSERKFFGTKSVRNVFNPYPANVENMVSS
jgi:hypothetical protein